MQIKINPYRISLNINVNSTIFRTIRFNLLWPFYFFKRTKSLHAKGQTIFYFNTFVFSKVTFTFGSRTFNFFKVTKFTVFTVYMMECLDKSRSSSDYKRKILDPICIEKSKRWYWNPLPKKNFFKWMLVNWNAGLIITFFFIEVMKGESIL